MENYTSKEILMKLNEQDILTREDYTFVEYVDNLMRFQEQAAKIVVGGENTHLVRMSEIISRCEVAAREKNMLFDPLIADGLRALRLISKEIAVVVAGKRGEKRVSKTLEYVTRPDAKIFNNVYISDDV